MPRPHTPAPAQPPLPHVPPSVVVNLPQVALSSSHRAPWHEARERLVADDRKPSREALDTEARRRWDSVLHFMVRRVPTWRDSH